MKSLFPILCAVSAAPLATSAWAGNGGGVNGPSMSGSSIPARTDMVFDATTIENANATCRRDFAIELFESVHGLKLNRTPFKSSSRTDFYADMYKSFEDTETWEITKYGEIVNPMWSNNCAPYVGRSRVPYPCGKPSSSDYSSLAKDGYPEVMLGYFGMTSVRQLGDNPLVFPKKALKNRDGLMLVFFDKLDYDFSTASFESGIKTRPSDYEMAEHIKYGNMVNLCAETNLPAFDYKTEDTDFKYDRFGRQISKRTVTKDLKLVNADHLRADVEFKNCQNGRSTGIRVNMIDYRDCLIHHLQSGAKE